MRLRSIFDIMKKFYRKFSQINFEIFLRNKNNFERLFENPVFEGLIQLLAESLREGFNFLGIFLFGR